MSASEKSDKHNYVVLRKRDDDLWDFLGYLMGESSESVEMRSVDAMNRDGEYIAIPLRYWTPTAYEIVTTRIVEALP